MSSTDGASPLLSSSSLKEASLRLGFVACGVSKAEPVAEPHARFYLRRVERRMYADMDYMYRNIDLRLSPQALMPSVKSIVSLAVSYMPHHQQPAIALYAQGRDYHDVLRQRMEALMQEVGLTGRPFVDTAPVMERYWAWRSGVGSFCRNGLIAVPGYGPTVFLCELFVEQEFDCYDSPCAPDALLPLPSAVASCASSASLVPSRPLASSEQEGPLVPPLPLDSSEQEGPLPGWQVLCPALTSWGLDAARCLSYLTIERRGALPDTVRLTTTCYGCDRCLRACPEFRESHPTDEPAFQPSLALLQMTDHDWRRLTVPQYQALFRGSAVKRAKYEGLMRNIARWHPSVVQ